jgi:hypothetical protein
VHAVIVTRAAMSAAGAARLVRQRLSDYKVPERLTDAGTAAAQCRSKVRSGSYEAWLATTVALPGAQQLDSRRGSGLATA